MSAEKRDVSWYAKKDSFRSALYSDLRIADSGDCRGCRAAMEGSFDKPIYDNWLSLWNFDILLYRVYRTLAEQEDAISKKGEEPLTSRVYS